VPTPKQQLATLYLKRDVSEYIAERRASGDSWRTIANAIRDDTKGRVDVTGETVRSWAP
jgi:hypothetical protein